MPVISQCVQANRLTDESAETWDVRHSPLATADLKEVPLFIIKDADWLMRGDGEESECVTCRPVDGYLTLHLWVYFSDCRRENMTRQG